METKTPILDLQATYKQYVANETAYYKKQIEMLTPETMVAQYTARFHIISGVSEVCDDFSRHAFTIQSALSKYDDRIDEGLKTAIISIVSGIMELNSYKEEMLKWIDELYYGQKYLDETKIWEKKAHELLNG